jgi:hypothetical protein
LIIRDALGLLSVLVLLGGAAVCAVYLSRASWAVVLMSGFALGAIGLGLSHLTAFLARHGHLVQARPALALASLFGLCGDVALVAGLAGVLLQLAASRSGASQNS